MPDVKYGIEDKIDHSGGWDWEDQHVAQAFNDPIVDGIDLDNHSVAIHDIVESGTVLIAAGPSDLDLVTSQAASTGDDPGFRLVPIGLVDTAQISMNKPLSRIFEIGSKLSYLIPGRTVGGISLSRVFFDGPSILKAIYAGEVSNDYASMTKKHVKFASNPHIVNGVETFHEVAHIGSGNLAMNLASSFFEQPVGLAFFFKDQASDTVGQTYFEGCRVNTYNMGIQAGMNVLQESINMEFVRCRPIVTSATYNLSAPAGSLRDLNIISKSSEQGA